MWRALLIAAVAATLPASAAGRASSTDWWGLFSGPGPYLLPTVYAHPHWVATGDLNGDGADDIVMDHGQAVAVVLGKQDTPLPNLDGAVDYPVGVPLPGFGSAATGIGIGDLDGDGAPDVVVANEDGNLSILRGTGTGTLAPATNIPVTTLGLDGLVLTDLNGDGDLDVAATKDGNKVAVLLGDGAGSFGAPLYYGDDSGDAASIVAGDLDGDGDPDLAVLDGLDYQLEVLPNRGDGTFGLPRGVALAPGVQVWETALGIGDLNGDGSPDLVYGGDSEATEDSRIGVLLNHGDGTFDTPALYTPDMRWPSWVDSLVVRDLNGDGVTDVAAAVPTPNNAPQAYQSWLHWLIGTGSDGRLTVSGALTPLDHDCCSYGLAAGDFDGNWTPDLVMVHHGARFNYNLYANTQSFSWTASVAPAAATVQQGGDLTVAISTALAVGKPEKGLQLRWSGQPPGSTVSISPSTIDVGDSATMTAHIPDTVPPGRYSLGVNAIGPLRTRSAGVVLTVTPNADFSLDRAPGDVTVVQGQQGLTTVSTAVTLGQPQPVALTAQGVPSGVTATFAPASVTAGESSTLSFDVTPAMAPGTYPITITGTGTHTSHTTTVNLTVTQSPVSDFRLDAAFTTPSLAQGSENEYKFGVRLVTGATQRVVFDVSGQPDDVDVTVTPQSVMVGGNPTVKFVVGPNAEPGTYPITVRGTGETATHAVTYTLTVKPAGFTMGASPDRLTIAPGASGTSTISTTLTPGGWDGGATLSASGQPAGTSVTFDPRSPHMGTSATMTVAVGYSTLPGTYPITVTGTGAGSSQAATVTLVVPPGPDFSLSLTASVTVRQGTAGSAYFSTAVVSGSPQAINLSAGTAPAGTTLSLSPSAVQTGGWGTLTFNVGASAPPGTYSIPLTGTSVTATHTATVSLTITPAADFSIAASPDTLTVAQGASGTTTLSTALTLGAAQTVVLSATGQPGGTTVGFGPASVTAGGSSTATVAVGPAAVPGNYTITVKGTGSNTTHTTTLALTVVPAPVSDFSVSASPQTFTLGQGSAASSTISTTVTAGAVQTVSLSASGLPPGMTASFSPASVVTGNTSRLSLLNGRATPPGTYTIVVSATGPSGTHTTSISLTVTAADFTLAASPSSITTVPGVTWTSKISSSPKGGTTDITFSATGQPAGTTVSFSPATVTTTVPSTMTVAVGATTPPGTYTIWVTGTGPNASKKVSVALTVKPAPVPGFTIVARPARLSLAQGTRGTFAVTTMADVIEGARVALSASGQPEGVTVEFSRPTVTAGQTSTMGVDVDAATPPGTYTITVTGTDPNATHSTTVDLTVTSTPPTPDFSLDVDPGVQTIGQGAWREVAVHTAVIAGSAQTVVLSATGAPDGTTLSFDRPTLTGDGGTYLMITVGASAAPGSYPITITGTGTSATHTATFTLVVTGPDFSLSASPSDLTVIQASGGYSTIVTGVVGAPQTVVFSATGPPGVDLIFNPTSVTAGGGTQLTVVPSYTTPPGTYTITVTGTGPSGTHTTTVGLTVVAAPIRDFSIDASPASLSLAQGSTGTSTISTAPISGTPPEVALSASGQPAGTTVTFSPTVVDAGRSATMTVAVGSSTPPGTYPITVTGTGPNATRTTTVTLTVAGSDFSVGASPAALSVVQGSAGTSTVSTAVTAGGPQTVVLSATGAPAGTTVGFSPSSVSAGAASTMTVDVGSSTAAGTYPITVTATGSSATHSTTVDLTVSPAAPAPDFAIAASPGALSVVQGDAGSATIATTLTAGAAQTVVLSASGQPAGTTVAFSPASVTSGGSSTMTVGVGASTPPGSYTITVTGAGSDATHSTTVDLTVKGAPPPVSGFSIAVSPGALSIVQGAGGSSTVSTAVTSGAAQTVVLSASGQPAGTTVGFSPASVSSGGSSTMSVSVGSSTAPGSYTITVTGTGASATHSATVALTVTAAPPAPDFSIGASPGSLSVVQGNAASSTIATTITAGAAQTVALSASGQPAGTTVGFGPASVTAGGSSTMTVSVGSATPPGSYTITVTGTGSGATHSTTVGLTVSAAGVDVVANGGFETGSFSGWAPSAAGAPLPAITSSAHSGAAAAQLGASTPFNGNSKLQQTIAVPAGSSQLSFWYQPHCLGANGKLDMQLRTTGGATLAKVLTGCSNSGAWTRAVYDTSAYAGQSIVLWWQAHDDGGPNDPVYVLLDDVRVG